MHLLRAGFLSACGPKIKHFSKCIRRGSGIIGKKTSWLADTFPSEQRSAVTAPGTNQIHNAGITPHSKGKIPVPTPTKPISSSTTI